MGFGVKFSHMPTANSARWDAKTLIIGAINVRQCYYECLFYSRILAYMYPNCDLFEQNLIHTDQSDSLCSTSHNFIKQMAFSTPAGGSEAMLSRLVKYFSKLCVQEMPCVMEVNDSRMDYLDIFKNMMYQYLV